MSGNNPQDGSKKAPPASGNPGEVLFSIDSDRSVQLEIPSVTRLLDRRKLELDREVAKAPAKPSIRGAARTERRSQARLTVWAQSPAASPAPADAGTQMLEKLTRAFSQRSGALWVLVLLRQSGAQDFEARSILGGDRTLWNLLTGFHWGKSVAPAAYEQLSRTRSLDLTLSTGEAEAKALRAALGLDASLGLWMLACGPGHESPGAILLAAVPASSGVAVILQQMRADFERSVSA